MDYVTENLDQVQTQFGRTAAAYATSQVHAKGASLALLLQAAAPQPDWRVLDVATGAGHTALLFAPYVAQVVAGDVTFSMLRTTAELAAARGIGNVVPAGADAQALPFAAGSFDLVTCRLGAHHFPRVAAFVAEAARVLRPGGVLAVVDNVVPGGRKKAAQAVGRYVNAFDKLRDPSHQQCLSLYAWCDQLHEAGFVLQHEETLREALDFAAWTARMQVPPEDVLRLRVMLAQAPAGVADFLTPQFSGDRITFYLTEALLVGTKPAHAVDAPQR